MATRPTVPTNFADGSGANRAAIPAGIRTDGYPFGSPFPSAQYDQREYEVGLWLGYLASLSPASDTLVLGKIIATLDPTGSGTFRITDDGGNAGTMRWLATKNGSSIVVGATGGAEDAAFVLTRATGAYTVTGAGWTWTAITQTGIVAAQASGIRYAYDTTESVSIDISPQAGGWTFQRATTGTSVGSFEGANAAATPLKGSSQVRPMGSNNTGDVWRRPFVEIEPSGGRGATVWTAVSISARIDEESNGNVRIRLCRRTRTSGSEGGVTDGSAVEFVVQSGTASGGPTTYTSATADTVLDLATYAYFFELDVVDLDPAGQPIIFVQMNMKKSAAD